MASLRAVRRAERSLPLSGLGANETTGISIYDWAKSFAPGAQVNYAGNQYQAYKLDGTSNGGVYRENPIVFSLEAMRVLLFAEVRLQFQQMRSGRPGDLFGTPDLEIVETPWPGHTTRDLLGQSEMDVFGTGNSYWTRDTDTSVMPLDAAKMTIVTEARTERIMGGQTIGDQLSGYVYKPSNDPRTWSFFTPEEVAHYKPYPDPNNRYVGMSWLSPCLPDITTDDLISRHKQFVMRNGASLATVVSFDPTVNREQFEWFVDKFTLQHQGPDNANKTLFLGGGADVKTVGQSFENLALKATQGGGETRVAACAGIPPVIVGLSEGLQGSSLNAGNYGQARRRLSDATMRPLWGTFASAFASLVKVPAAARLWYDDRDVAFLREDLQDQAQILETQVRSIKTLLDAGYHPDAAVETVLNSDVGRLTGQHSGLYSVQLQPPGTGNPPTSDAATPTHPALVGATNGDSSSGNGTRPRT